MSLVLSFSTLANDTNPAKDLLLEMASAVHTRNFDASFVVVKGKSMEPYRWVHAKQGDIELEHLSLLNGAGLEMIRIDDQVTYFEPQSEPYSLTTDSIAGPIPEVLFKDINRLSAHYDFVLGGKGRIAGRPAQLVRIESKNDDKYNYWIWIDTESSLLLKAAYVSLTVVMIIVISSISFKTINKTFVDKASITKKKVLVVFGLVFWQLYIYIVGFSGVLETYELPPRFPIFLIFPAFIFTGVFIYRNRNNSWVQNINSKTLIYIQSFRILVEVIFVFSLSDVQLVVT